MRLCCYLFVAINSPPVEYVHLNKAISIGSKILVFQGNEESILCYDVDKNKWSEESCEVTEDLEEYSCVKLLSY